MTRVTRAGVAIALAVLPGCWLPSHPIGIELRSKTQFESEWNGYLELPPPKALAVAGNLDGVYVSGFASGTASSDEAVEEALRHCEERRADRRVQEACWTYAVGDCPLP